MGTVGTALVNGECLPIRLFLQRPPNPRLKADDEDARLSGSLIRNDLAAWR